MDGKSLPNAAHTDGSALLPYNRRPLGFPRACRLLRRADYDRVYKDGRRRTSQHFVVFYRTNSGESSRLGISVKRALGGAVVRNRIRRRIREIFRTHRQEIQPGWDIVIHPRSSVATADFAPLSTELVSLLQKALAA